MAEKIRIEVISGVEGDCVAINDYRVAGPKPWGGGQVKKVWECDKKDILRALQVEDENG